MAGMENNSSKKKITTKDASEVVKICEDEISLIDLFLVLWKWKIFVLVGSIVPTLTIGLIIYFIPHDYTVTYTYDVTNQATNQITNQTTMDVSNWNLNEKNYNILLGRFYSKENLSRIINKLQQVGLNKYATSISNARRKQKLEKLLKLKVLPPFINITETRQADFTQLERLRSLQAQLLNITIVTNSKKDIYKISSVVRENFETIIPMYFVAEQLNASINNLRAEMAAIQENKFGLQLDLEKNKNILAKLKNIKTENSNKNGSDIILQFDVGGRSEYLPVEYQIQTAESEVIKLEETIRDYEKKYEHYQSLLSLSEKLLIELENKKLLHYSIQQFYSFLLESITKIEKQELKDYLNSYIKKIENRIAVSTAVTENPSISAIAKGTIKKSAVVFLIALMMSVFASFLLEGLKKAKTGFRRNLTL